MGLPGVHCTLGLLSWFVEGKGESESAVCVSAPSPHFHGELEGGGGSVLCVFVF